MSERRIIYPTYTSEQYLEYVSPTDQRPSYPYKQPYATDLNYAYDATVYGSPPSSSSPTMYSAVDQSMAQMQQSVRRSSQSHQPQYSATYPQTQPHSIPSQTHNQSYPQPSTSPRSRPRSHSQAVHPYPAGQGAPFVPRQNPAYQYPPEVSLSAVQDTSQYSTAPPRPFACPLCSLSFNRHHDLKRHQETHSGEKPYLCNGNCGKTFTRKDALKRHQLVKGCGTIEEAWS